MKNKKIITICSSASFYKEVIAVEKELKNLGFKVKIPSTANRMKRSDNFNVDHYKTWYKNSSDFHKKTKLMTEHFKKVIESDGVLVVNKTKKGIRGYIGGNGLMEMLVAFLHKKPIYILNPVSKKSSLFEEIMGLNPIFIQEDLTKIK